MKSVAIAIVCAATVAHADPVAVKVTEIAGGIAYVTPGRAAGIVPGMKVRMRSRQLVVVEVTEKTAALRLDGAAINPGDAGTADVAPGGVAALKPLDKPRAPDTFTGQWPEPVVPAQVQSPTSVPLGTGRAPGRKHVTVIGHAFGVADGSRVAGDTEARVIASYDLMVERPLAADLDVSMRLFTDGSNSHTRTPLFVRAAQLRYGDARDPRFALGRLRFAASSVGMLDGARASAHVGVVEVAAFGGIVPDPLSGKPDTSASRFGGEVAYDDTKSDWQPRVALEVTGSTFSGKLDERRAGVFASAGHDAVWLDGWAEVQSFAADNPWRASAVELTGAGSTVEWRKHGKHVGLDVTFLRPERSLRLAAALPAEWLCTLAPQPGNVAETCTGNDFWASASASAGMRSSSFAIDAVGSVGDTHTTFKGVDASGYLHTELRVGRARALAGVSAGRASFASWTAAEMGAGFSPIRKLDVAARYRPELLDYKASAGRVLLHSIVADAHYTMSTVLDLAASALLTTGTDRNSLAILATVVWRPLP